MTSPDPSRPYPTGMLDGLGGIAAWANKTREEYEADVLGGVTESTKKIKLFGGGVAGTQSELAGLQSRTQKLEGVIGYAHAYANGGISLSLGSVKYPMSNQIGPVVGTTMTNGAFILGSKGLWVADGQATFDFLNAGVKKISMTLKVYAPNGSEHFKRTSIFDTGEQNTRSVHMPFTVPSAGYYVELWVNAAFGRGVFGGSEWNGLSVNKISTEEN
ncbi:hypothetical protein QM716_11755 [Rhodococcus sp. IEGM 1409]|uniref:hypothetical protein n=1 Tax=Rhodococcus sp. IEGM 1409 TaxID=3047082 RepID=UPI0024B80AE6|nr:hypothetical protein [Rhodococcus sp. IEGM 1409]MDI9900527.1 hypothetical protein [Rhodococcus sp. IEGM 1409]